MPSSTELLREALLQALTLHDHDSKEYTEWLHSRSHPLPLTIPAGNSRSWPITQKALDALADISESVRLNSKLERVVDKNGAFQAACRVFGEMLPELARIDDEKDAWKEFKRRLLGELMQGLRTTTHYIPVWLFVRQDYEDFQVGPVRFLKRDTWVDAVEQLKGAPPLWKGPVLLYWDGKPEVIEGLDVAQKIDARLVAKFASSEQRIAAVTLSGFNATESSRRALLATRVALDALRALVPAGNMASFMTSADHAAPGLVEVLTQRQGTDVFAGAKANRPGLGGSPGLATGILDASAGYRAAAGSLIEVLLNPAPASDASRLPTLSERWCNAVHWFGRACTVEEDFAALPMCAIALDILSGGLELRGIRELGALLLEISEDVSVTTRGTALKKVLSDIYEARNHIFHGSELVVDKPLAEERVVAQGIAAAMLVRYAERLAEYMQTQAPEDDRDTFSRWLASRTGAAASSAAPPSVC